VAERRLALLVCAAAASALPGQDISPVRLRAHVRFLSSDLLEGRGAGTRGGDLATEYLASQLAVAGAQPGGENGTWFQPVPLVAVRTGADSWLSVNGARLEWLTEFAGQARTQAEVEEFSAEAVFVGHGITAPEFGHDDYAGADVAGKVVVLFANEPPSADPAWFGGPALTYYGRWTYKFEEALRRGAAAAILVHTPDTAGYGWDVVRSSWGGEEAQVKASGPALRFAGWVTEAAAARLFAASGRSVKEWLAAAGARGFRATPLGVKVSGRIGSKLREIRARNVVGRISGGAVAEETVLFSAHWDHLGMASDGAGDRIYNGAVDNATGCAIVLEVARAWAALQPKPRRSATFLFTAAEESGLLGARHWVSHPLAPLARTVLALNFDSFHPFGRTRDVVVHGAEKTPYWDTVRRVVERNGLQVAPDPRPEQGSFFRSDHFPFFQAGVPAFSVAAGPTYEVRAEQKAALRRDYAERHYHQPSDEYRDDWDFAGLDQIARLGFQIAFEAANRR